MRISRPQMFLDMAEVAAKRSTCYRGNTGSIIVRDNDIISMGYNGAPSGEPHCAGNECPLTDAGGCLRSVHAEKNAIDRAKRKISSLSDCILFTVSAPCVACAELIVDHKLMAVYYRYPYRDPRGLKHLMSRGIVVHRVTPSGIVIDEASGEIVES